jgi:hypothetical protein
VKNQDLVLELDRLRDEHPLGVRFVRRVTLTPLQTRRR